MEENLSESTENKDLPEGIYFEEGYYNRLFVFNSADVGVEQINVSLTLHNQLHFLSNKKSINLTQNEMKFVLQFINSYKGDDLEGIEVDRLILTRGLTSESLRVVISRLNTKLKNNLNLPNSVNLIKFQNGRFVINPKIKLYYIEVFE